jgi:hypothetical protein
MGVGWASGRPLVSGGEIPTRGRGVTPTSHREHTAISPARALTSFPSPLAPTISPTSVGNDQVMDQVVNRVATGRRTRRQPARQRDRRCRRLSDHLTDACRAPAATATTKRGSRR